MLNLEIEDDLGLGSRKVETLDPSNSISLSWQNGRQVTLCLWKSWLSIESRITSINIQNRADICHQVMTNNSQNWDGFGLYSWMPRAPSWWVAQACPVIWLTFQHDLCLYPAEFLGSCLLHCGGVLIFRVLWSCYYFYSHFTSMKF